MIRVKICGLTRPEDARAAAAAGADAAGLVFAPSPRQVNEVQAKKVIAALPAYMVRVGVFVDQDPEWILGLAGRLGLDRVQLHGRETAAVLRRFPAARVIRSLRPKTDAPLPEKNPAPAAAALLVDAWVPGAAGGTGKLANWAYARWLKRFGKTLILSGGLHAGNVAEAIRKVRPDVVDVSSGVEIAPGIKSAAKIKAFIKAVQGSGGSCRPV